MDGSEVDTGQRVYLSIILANAAPYRVLLPRWEMNTRWVASSWHHRPLLLRLVEEVQAQSVTTVQVVV